MADLVERWLRPRATGGWLATAKEIAIILRARNALDHVAEVRAEAHNLREDMDKANLPPAVRHAPNSMGRLAL